MGEQKDLPTSRGSMAAEWAGLSPQQRERVASLFLRLRKVAPEVKAASPSRMWRDVVELVQKHPAAPHSSDLEGFAFSDLEGLAFIRHMDAITREAVVEHLLPPGSRVHGCIATLQGGAR